MKKTINKSISVAPPIDCIFHHELICKIKDEKSNFQETALSINQKTDNAKNYI